MKPFETVEEYVFSERQDASYFGREVHVLGSRHQMWEYALCAII